MATWYRHSESYRPSGYSKERIKLDEDGNETDERHTQDFSCANGIAVGHEFCNIEDRALHLPPMPERPKQEPDAGSEGEAEPIPFVRMWVQDVLQPYFSDPVPIAGRFVMDEKKSDTQN